MTAAAKYQRVAEALAERIRAGQISREDRLPGEIDLAVEFSVSRGTIRQALATLQQDGLIQTSLGAGSFVTYDGRPLEDSFGWSKSLARGGVEARTRIVAFGRLEIPSLAKELNTADAHFLIVERVRYLSSGEAVSLERSRLPWRASFESVLIDGLVNSSIQATLAAHGVVSMTSHEVVGIALLGADEARELNRRSGDAFLETQQTAYDQAGDVVERVNSLLDPNHFLLEHTFGR